MLKKETVFKQLEKEKDISHKMPVGQSFLLYVEGVGKKEIIDLKHFIQELKKMAAIK